MSARPLTYLIENQFLESLTANYLIMIVLCIVDAMLVIPKMWIQVVNYD